MGSGNGVKEVTFVKSVQSLRRTQVQGDCSTL